MGAQTGRARWMSEGVSLARADMRLVILTPVLADGIVRSDH